MIYTGAGRGTKAVKIEKQGDGFVAKELWSNPDVAPQFNTPVLKDGLLFGLSDRGQLFCINADSGQTAWTDTRRARSRLRRHCRRRLLSPGPAQHLRTDRLQAQRQPIRGTGRDQGLRHADLCAPGDRREPDLREGRGDTDDVHD